MMRSTHCFPVKGRLHLSSILCFPPWNKWQFFNKHDWFGHSTELLKHIQCVDNLVTWIMYNTLISVACIQDVTTINHWSQDCPHLAAFENESGFRPVNLYPPAAPSGPHSVAGHQTGSREQEKKACLYKCERYMALASHGAGLPDDLAVLRTAIVGGRVGILIDNCSITNLNKWFACH